MSNLAGNLIGAGFLKEAQEKCDAAMRLPSPHKNIAQKLLRLSEIAHEEDDKQKEILDKAKPKAEFYRRMGQAIARAEHTEIAGRWESPDCALSVAIVGKTFSATGTFERPAAGLGMALALTPFASPSKSETVSVRYKGTIQGHTITAAVSRDTKDKSGNHGAATTLLGSMTDKLKALMIIDEGGLHISVMEMPQFGEPKFYELKRGVT